MSLYERTVRGAHRAYKLTLSPLIGRPMPLSADLFGLCGRGPDQPRPLARRIARRPAAVPMPSLGRIGLSTRSRPAPPLAARRTCESHDRTEVSPTARAVNSRTGSSGRDVAASISPSLEKRAAADQAGRPAHRPRPAAADPGGAIEIVTRDAPEALEVIRHDTAHVLAEAVQELFPGTQVTIGPNVEDGFYYDFARNEPFSLDDLPTIEQRMREIVDRDEKITREVVDRDAAIADFKAMGETYKAEIIEGIPAGEAVTVYHQGAWKDLCRGPHLPSTQARRQGVQADQARRRLLARRPAQRPAAAHLRHRLGDRGRPRRLPQADRGGGKARPPQARRGHGPLPHPGRGQGHGVLAPEGLDALPHAGRLHAPPLEAEAGYRRGEDAADPRPLALGTVGPLGEVPRRHVRLRDRRGRDARGQADELPRPHPDLQSRPAQLSRAADRAWRSSRGCTATKAPAACTACCACAAWRRTTATSSAARTRSRARRATSWRSCNRVYADLGVELHAVKLALRPELRARHGRDVGHDRGHAGAAPRARSGSSSRSCPARAASMRQSWSST